MPFNLGGPELIIVLVIVLIVFGAGKLPNVMRDVGKGVKEFKKAQSEVEAEEAASRTTTTVSAPPPAAPVSNGASASSTSSTSSAPATTHTSEPAHRA